jgi:predicted nucleic acid-binding protein
LETEAVLLVLEMCGGGAHQWIVSEAVEWEVARNPDDEKRRVVEALLRFADERLPVGDPEIVKARSYADQGISGMDALHLALAERGRCDVLLSTDAHFLRRAKLLNPPSTVRVANPAEWVLEIQP